MSHRQFFVASLVALAGSLIAPVAAQANSQEVLFNGRVLSSCSFSNKQDGTLGLTLAGTMFSSLATGGTSGQVTITCNGPATLTVNPPEVKPGAPTGYNHATATKTASVTGGGVGLSINVPNGSLPGTGVVPSGASNLQVDMTAGLTTPLPVGDYTFGVTLTASGL